MTDLEASQEYTTPAEPAVLASTDVVPPGDVHLPEKQAVVSSIANHDVNFSSNHDANFASDVVQTPESGNLTVEPTSSQTAPATSDLPATETAASSGGNQVNEGAPAQQYLVVLAADQNGKLFNASSPAPGIATSGMSINSIAPKTPITVKRGAIKPSPTPTGSPRPTLPTLAKSTPVTTTATITATTATTTMMGTTLPQNTQGIRLISMPISTTNISNTSSSSNTSNISNNANTSNTLGSLGTTTQIFTPVACMPGLSTLSTVPTVTTVTNVKKPAPASPVLKPAGVVISRAPVVKPVTTAPSAGTVLLNKKPPTKPSPLPQIQKAPLAKMAITPTTTPSYVSTTKQSKPLAAVDRMMQQKRLVAESLLKLRKIEGVMVQAKADVATPFTYGEMFHQAAVSFSKMASLTQHISLESQMGAEQRRWTPELINRFVGAVGTFASSMKEVGDELRKRHEQQLAVNLKRKADSEVLHAKKQAAMVAPPSSTVTSSSPTVTSSSSTVTSLPSTVVTSPSSTVSTSVPVQSVQSVQPVQSTGSNETPAEEQPLPETSVKHPLEISTVNNSAAAISNLLSAARTNGVEGGGSSGNGGSSGGGSGMAKTVDEKMDTSSQEVLPAPSTQGEGKGVGVSGGGEGGEASAEVKRTETGAVSDQSQLEKGGALEENVQTLSASHHGLTNGFAEEILNHKESNDDTPTVDTVMDELPAVTAGN